MNHVACKQLSTAEVIQYWLDELGNERAAKIEEHLFACASCNAQLESIVSLGLATRQLVQQGKITTTLTPGSLRELKATGLRLREYHVDPGGKVNCTITPEDDLVVSHLHTPLAGVRRIDLVIDDIDTAWQIRASDIGFDPVSDEVVVIPRAEDVRNMHRATHRMRLFSVDDSGERLLGEYLFHHSRHPDQAVEKHAGLGRGP